LKSKKLLYPYLIWMMIFVLVPLAMVVYYSFTDKNGVFTFDNFKYIVKYADVYLESLEIAFLTTVICLILAYPLALIMSRMKISTQRMVNMLIMLPMWMNFILRICAWMVLLDSNGIINRVLSFIGLGPYNMLYTRGAIVVGMVYNFLPFMVLPLYTVISKIDNSLIEAGQDLGCSGFNILRKIVFPLSIPGIITGITMVFVPSASTFIVSQRLGGYNLIGDTIEQYYVGTSPNMNIGSTLALALMIIILISTAIMNHFDKDDDIVLM